MDALVEEDFERQRSRTPWDRKGEVQTYRTSNHKRNLALGKLDAFAETLPLRSMYYDSCAEYYSESQMGVSVVTLLFPVAFPTYVALARRNRGTGFKAL